MMHIVSLEIIKKIIKIYMDDNWGRIYQKNKQYFHYTEINEVCLGTA